MKELSQIQKHLIKFSLDLLGFLVSFFLAYGLRFNFDLPAKEINNFPIALPFFLTIRISLLILAGFYKRSVEFTTLKDIIYYSAIIFIGTILLLVGNFVRYHIGNNEYFIPISVLGIEFMSSTLFISGWRVLGRFIFLEKELVSRENVIIYGGGRLGVITKRALEMDTQMKYKIVAFIDDDRNKRHTYIEGVPVYHYVDLEKVSKEYKPSRLILAIQNIHPTRKAKIFNKCVELGIKPMYVPSISTWINGILTSNQIKYVKPEDLLEREEVEIMEDALRNFYFSKKILITGAAGSIGGEIARILTTFSPSLLILVDRAESPLYENYLDIKEIYKFKDVCYHLTDICDIERLGSIFEQYRPNIVIHAAALKHVPILEFEIYEALKVNCLGTANILEISNKYNVDNLIYISTDKAVKPINVLGLSKRVGEILTAYYGNRKRYCSVRFGNVLGSQGSFLKILQKQFENGNIITITHKDATRYFMSIQEACLLTLHSIIFSQGGEVFILNMGKPIRIYDLAMKVAALYSKRPDIDFTIKYIGLRPGEKVHEELYYSYEKAEKTPHKDIFKINLEFSNIQEIINLVNEMKAKLNPKNADNYLSKIKILLMTENDR